MRQEKSGSEQLSVLEQPHVFYIPAGATISDLDSYLSRVDSDSAAVATSFVFEISDEQFMQLASLQSRDTRRELISRAAGRNLFVLTFKEGQHLLCRIEETGLESIGAYETAGLRLIRQNELCGLVRQSADHCFYRATARHHFVAPSGSHCSLFFRVGDVISSRASLDRLVFWSLPAVANCGAILVDNWSISAIAIRALQRQRLDLPFDSLSAHPSQNRPEAREVIGKIVHLLGEGKSLLCLVSVASSGSFESNVRDIAREFNLPDERLNFLGLYRLKTQAASMPALCDLDEEPKNHPGTNCPFCQTGSTPVAVHPGLYYLKEFPEKPVTLQERHFTNRAFIRRYGTRLNEMFTVHRNDRNDRHHAFHVDMAPLLEDADFVSLFRLKLRELEASPQIVITPQDPTSEKLGRLASGFLNVPHIAVDSIRAHSLQGEAAQLLATAKRLLIVDDVLISGARMEAHNKALRERNTPLDSVDFLVALARPASLKIWNQIQGALTTRVTWRTSLRATETFFLPDWKARFCPWCREFEFLAEVSGMQAAPAAWLADRLNLLTARATGLHSEPLLVLPGVATRRLGQGSLVAPEQTTSMATLFSAASALQALRTDEDENRRLNPHYPWFQVFAARNLANYSEGLLRATILRTVASGEWGLTMELPELERFLREVAPLPDQDIILGEILIAAVRGVVDKDVVSSLKNTLLRYVTDDTYDAIEKALRRA